MKDHKPAYYTDEPGNLRIKSNDDEIQAHQREVKENLKDFIDEIVDLKNIMFLLSPNKILRSEKTEDLLSEWSKRANIRKARKR
ncbi:hypothetical protein KDE12_00045 [Campylobacter sp. faydin G-105]|uniref:hypothetical protein n=1 Tax=Campylobacter anatolicus TaxID=2829105 RepID=UPI001B99174B|nr:hypothetical protein [Campylobacter anatolicus]MBR8461245.1 hypothetical protein [Campylobacter anatolicus]